MARRVHPKPLEYPMEHKVLHEGTEHSFRYRWGTKRVKDDPHPPVRVLAVNKASIRLPDGRSVVPTEELIKAITRELVCNKHIGPQMAIVENPYEPYESMGYSDVLD